MARHRGHPAGARSARCLDLRAAHLRRLHHRARDRLGARDRERAGARGAAQRAVHPQHDHRRARHPRSHRPLLPALGARLGRHRLGAAGGSEGRRRHRAELVGLAAEQRRRVHQGPAEDQRLRRFRPARRVRQRLLGAPGDEAAAGGQPAGGRALPAGARLPAARQPDRRRPRLEDAAHPEPGGRRGLQPDQPEQPVDADAGATLQDQVADRRDRRVRQPGLSPRCRGDRRALCRLDAVRSGRHHLSLRPRHAARQQEHAVRAARTATSRPATSPPSARSPTIRTATSRKA